MIPTFYRLLQNSLEEWLRSVFKAVILKDNSCTHWVVRLQRIKIADHTTHLSSLTYMQCTCASSCYATVMNWLLKHNFVDNRIFKLVERLRSAFTVDAYGKRYCSTLRGRFKGAARSIFSIM